MNIVIIIPILLIKEYVFVNMQFKERMFLFQIQRKTRSQNKNNTYTQ
jgi:hypothetical protein